MATITTQMNGDPVSASELSQQRRCHWFRFANLPSLSNSRNVINIYAKSHVLDIA
jgi:hypothetical protein